MKMIRCFTGCGDDSTPFVVKDHIKAVLPVLQELGKNCLFGFFIKEA